jgi:hypothetical protein
VTEYPSLDELQWLLREAAVGDEVVGFGLLGSTLEALVTEILEYRALKTLNFVDADISCFRIQRPDGFDGVEVGVDDQLTKHGALALAAQLIRCANEVET